MNTIIIEKLKEIEQSYNLKILYACESGSRAWGFPSLDSDYDVRFIYVHPKEHYLAIDEQRDVIDLPINDLLDINGWELRKALRLFKKSNSPLYEWLQSPIVYQQHDTFIHDLKKLIPCYFSLRAAMHHYLSMTKAVFNNDLLEGEVRLKKYFYALRTMLACYWIADRREVPPMELQKLQALLNSGLKPIVGELLEQKTQATEKVMVQQINSLNKFIQEGIIYCSQKVDELAPINVDSEMLNNLFRKYIA